MSSPPKLPNGALGFFWRLEGRAWEKRGGSGRNRELWEGRTLGVLFFFIIQNPPNLGELKKILEEDFRRLWRV